MTSVVFGSLSWAQRTGFVFLGGGVGSLVRFACAEIAKRGWGEAAIPFATLTVNVVGSCIVGLVYGYFPPDNQDFASQTWRHLVVVGMMGGLTTYSGFSWETVRLLDQKAYGLALLYVAGTALLCIGVCYAGFAAVRSR